MRILPIIICCLPSACFAFFCPNNFSQIDFGNTIDQVTQACGKPDKESTKDAEPNVPQEWTYYVPQPAGAPGMTTQQPPAVLKATINFDKDGKAIYIGVNGIGIGSSNFCTGTVQLGATLDEVKSACGKPASISKENPQSDTPQQKIKITEFNYGGKTLVFKDGVLTSKE